MDMTNPGVQNPHWTPCPKCILSWIGCNSPSLKTRKVQEFKNWSKEMIESFIILGIRAWMTKFRQVSVFKTIFELIFYFHWLEWTSCWKKVWKLWCVCSKISRLEPDDTRGFDFQKDKDLGCRMGTIKKRPKHKKDCGRGGEGQYFPLEVHSSRV